MYHLFFMHTRLCKCGQKYFFCRNLVFLTETKSKKAKYWYDWAKNTKKNLCKNLDCNAQFPNNEEITISGESEEELNFIKYVKSKELSLQRSYSRQSEGKTTKKQFLEIAKLQKYKCYFCLKDLTSHPDWYDPSERGKIANWDHLQPATKGGTHWPLNMALTCRECNFSKGNKTELEFWNYMKKSGKKELVKCALKFNESYYELKEKV